MYHSLDIVPEFIYRKVYMKGRWDHAHTILLGPRVYDSRNGFHVVTPFIRSDGSTILVDRGFITPEVAEASSWSRQEGEVEILGMLRMTQARNKFTPDNNPDKGVWYWADVPAIAEYAGGSGANVQPVYVEEIFGEKNRAFFSSLLPIHLTFDSQRAMQVKPPSECPVGFLLGEPPQLTFAIRIDPIL